MPFATLRPARRSSTENPATGRPSTDVASGDAVDIDAAVRAARAVFDDGRWSRMAPADRKQVLLRFADALEANADELATLDALEVRQADHRLPRGRPARPVKTFRWYAEAIDKVLTRSPRPGPTPSV